MATLKSKFPIVPYWCDRCQAVTNQVEKIVSDFPEFTRALLCPKCENFGIVLHRDTDA